MTTYHGIAYGARALGRRSRHSSRRRHDRPGRAGKPRTGRRAAGDSDGSDREVCRMQDATTILGIIRDRGKWGLPLTRVYPLLYNPDLYLRAYGRLYPN